MVHYLCFLVCGWFLITLTLMAHPCPCDHLLQHPKFISTIVLLNSLLPGMAAMMSSKANHAGTAPYEHAHAHMWEREHTAGVPDGSGPWLGGIPAVLWGRVCECNEQQ